MPGGAIRSGKVERGWPQDAPFIHPRNVANDSRRSGHYNGRERMEPNDLDFDRLHAEHGAALFRFCWRLCGDRARAEDLAQDAFVAALRSRDRFRQAASPKTWLFGIALNLVRKDRRRRVLERAFRLASSSSPDPDGSLDLGRAIDALPPRLREPFLLVKGEGFTSAEAGSVLGLPEGTVRAQVHEAIVRLRLQLQPSPTPSEETSYAL